MLDFWRTTMWYIQNKSHKHNFFSQYSCKTLVLKKLTDKETTLAKQSWLFSEGFSEVREVLWLKIGLTTLSCIFQQGK